MTSAEYSKHFMKLLLLIYICANKSLAHYNYVSYNLSWTSAEIFCKSQYNGSLASFSEDLRRIIPMNTSVWVGDFKTVTPWMYYKGCQNLTTIQSEALAMYKQSSGNSPAICQKQCNGRTLFAITAHYCFCLPDTMKPMPDSTHTHCNTFCSSPYQNFACGGEDDVASVYSVVNVTSIGATITQNCATMECNGTKHILYADDCNDMFPFVCYDLDFQNDTKTWYNSSSSCSTLRNSVLQVVFQRNNVCDERYFHNTKYWIGLFRNTLNMQTIDGEFKTAQTCYYATKTNADVMMEESRNCQSKYLPFYCKSGSTWTANVTDKNDMLSSSSPAHINTDLVAGLLTVFLLLSLSMILLILWKRGYVSPRCQKQRSSSVSSWSRSAQNPLYPFQWLRRKRKDKIEPKVSEIIEDNYNTISDTHTESARISTVGGYHDMSIKRKNDSYEDEYTEMNCVGLEDDNEPKVKDYTNEKDKELAISVDTIDQCSELTSSTVTWNEPSESSGYTDERKEQYAVPVYQDSSEYSVIPEKDVPNFGNNKSLVNNQITERDEEYADPVDELEDYDDILNCQQSENTLRKSIAEIGSGVKNDKNEETKQNCQTIFNEIRDNNICGSDDENIYEEYENTSQFKKS